MNGTGTVYLLHFSQPYKHARHYLGFATNLQSRMQQHASGNGARLIEVISQAGIGWRLVRAWYNKPKVFERKLKRRHGAASLCPVCNPKTWHTNASE